MMDAKTVVEIGVFRGMTTLAFALCLRRLEEKSEFSHKRRVIALDISEEFTEIGKKSWHQAGVEKIIDFRVGDAKYSLKTLLEEEGEESVDLCFIDADKSSYDDYYEKCLKITKKGGLIVIDNTLWGARVLINDNILDALHNINENTDARNTDSLVSKTNMNTIMDAKSIKDLTKKISSDERVERVCFLTIADGVTICRKK
uniref:Caffeoyl-CoA O-methyltransferase n=1 Tax=Eucampia antarctica TaxID=49252 RepID=A0A7S2R823_9STRA